MIKLRLFKSRTSLTTFSAASNLLDRSGNYHCPSEAEHGHVRPPARR